MISIADAYSLTLENLDSYPNHIRNDKSGIDIYIKTIDATDVVLIRRSNELRDWITNFTFWFRPWKRPDYAREDSPIRVHSGYFNGWMKIRDRVLATLTQPNIIVVGYSMGGGVSTIAAVDIEYNKNPESLYCYSFGGPRVWNTTGMNSTNARLQNSYRIKNGNDIVTKLPPWYKHSGTCIHIGKKEYWWKLSYKDHLEFMLDPSSIQTKLFYLPDCPL